MPSRRELCELRDNLSLRATFVVGADGVVRASFVTPRDRARSLGQYREALAAVSA